MFQGVFEVLKLQYFKFLRVLPLSELYSEPSQTSQMEFYTENRILFSQKDSF